MTVDEKKIGEDKRFQNGLIQKSSQLNVLMQTKWPDIWQDKMTKNEVCVALFDGKTCL